MATRMARIVVAPGFCPAASGTINACAQCWPCVSSPLSPAAQARRNPSRSHCGSSVWRSTTSRPTSRLHRSATGLLGSTRRGTSSSVAREARGSCTAPHESALGTAAGTHSIGGRSSPAATSCRRQCDLSSTRTAARSSRCSSLRAAAASSSASRGERLSAGGVARRATAVSPIRSSTSRSSSAASSFPCPTSISSTIRQASRPTTASRSQASARRPKPIALSGSCAAAS